MTGKWMRLAGAALAAGFLLFLFFWSRQVTPEMALEQLFNMDAPSRYVFVGDEELPRMASVDGEAQTLAAMLAVQTVPRIMAMDKSRGLLAYASGEENLIVVRELASHNEQVVVITHGVRGMVFAEDALFVYDDSHVTWLNAALEVQRSWSDFSALASVQAAALADVLVLLDTDAVWRLSWREGELSRLALPESWRVMTRAALSADGEWLLFGVEDTDKNEFLAVAWQMENGAGHTFAMHAPLLQPLMDNGMQAFFFVDSSGAGLKVSSDFAEISRFTTAKDPQRLVLGWLDQHLLVMSEKEWWLHDANTLETLASTPAAGKARDVFVSADSKTALVTQQGSKALVFYALRDGAMQTLTLADMAAPGRVMMGAGYTLCH